MLPVPYGNTSMITTVHEHRPSRRRPVNRDVGVITAEPADVDQLARVLAAAFHPLTFSRFLIPDDDDRRKIYPEYFKQVYLQPGIAHGIVHRTGDGLGCAVWFPMGDADEYRPETDPDVDTALRLLAGQYYPSLVEFDRLLTAAHAAYLTTPHDFLDVVAAHPAVQRQGNLHQLMQARLPQLDMLGRPSYLEAAEPYLVPVYEKFGYRRTAAVIELPNGRMYPMWREPRC